MISHKLFRILPNIISISFFFGTAVFSAGCAMKSKVSDSEYHGLGRESVNPQILAEFAPPALDPELGGRIRNLLEVQTPGLGILSPDGKSMFFGWNVSGVTQVWKSDGPMRFPVQMTSGSDATMINDVTSDGKYLIVSRDHNGEENPGLYLMSTDGGSLTEIYHAGKVQARLAWASSDNETVYYFANDIKADSYAFYRYSISEKKRELLFSQPGLWETADVWADHVFLFAKRTGSLTSEYWVFNAADHKLTPVLGQNEMQQYDVRFGRGPGEFIVRTPKFTGFNRLYAVDQQKWTPITPEVEREVESFHVDYSRMHLYIGWNSQGYGQLEVRNFANFSKVVIPGIEGENVFLGGTSRFGRYATIGIESSTSPRKSYVYDWKLGTLTQWVKPSLPEVDAAQFTPAKLESYPARDGTVIPMFVSRPAACSKKSCPVIVAFHGGPEGQARPIFNRTAQIMTAAGFIYVEPNVRGSTGYGQTWLAADDGVKRINVITDIEDCALFIKKNWSKNARTPKIGVIGGSYGGYAALMAMSRFAGAYDAGISIVGISNLKSFLLNTAPYRRVLRISEYGDPVKDADILEKLSPITYIDQVKAPLMLMQGLNDPRVPVGEALQMHAKLKARGIDSPLIIFPDEGHGSGKKENRVLELGFALKFFTDMLAK